MYPLAVGKDYCLRLSDGRTLGHVRIARIEDAWAEGSFQPGAAFAEFRELFSREARLRHDQLIPLWEEVADEIDGLGIEVVENGQEPVQAGMRVFIEGDEAILGPPSAVP